MRWNVVWPIEQRVLDHRWRRSIVGNHVIVGVSGDFDNLPRLLRSIDPETGKTQWEWDSTPPPGTPNAPTGGMTWMTGTYDPDLNLLYWGTGNPTPGADRLARPGDNLYTCSIVALESRYRKTGLGLPALAARHTRLGCCRNARAG